MMLKRAALAVLIGVACVGAVRAVDAPKARALFNGKDFTGWETWLAIPPPTSEVPGMEKDAKGNYTKPLGLNNDPLGVFKVELIDGQPTIHASGEGHGTLTTLAPYSNYHLRMQFKWGQRRLGPANRPRNGGVLYHAYGQHGDNGGRWMNTHQYQVEEGGCADYVGVGPVVAEAPAKTLPDKRRVYDVAGGGAEFHGNVRELAKCTRGAGEEAAAGDWNTLDLYCVGTDIVQVLNGKVAVRLTKSRKESGEPLSEGRIALQIEGAELYFRDIVLTPLAVMPERL
jgi:hypothetical protein